METEKKVNKSLDVTEDESEAVSRLVVPVIPTGGVSFYDAFVVRGIRVNRVEPGLVVCTLKVPPRFTVSLLNPLTFLIHFPKLTWILCFFN